MDCSWVVGHPSINNANRRAPSTYGQPASGQFKLNGDALENGPMCGIEQSLRQVKPQVVAPPG